MNFYGWEYLALWLAQAGHMPIPEIKGVDSVPLRKSMGALGTRQLYQFVSVPIFPQSPYL